MEVLFIMALAAGLGALIVKAVRHHNRQITEAWSEAASQLGMRFAPGSFRQSKSIQGVLYDHQVTVDTYTRSTGKSSTKFTRFRIDFPESLGLGLKLKQQGFLAGVATFFGSQDIEVGDPQFDPQVVVKGADPRRVARFLTPARRLRILRLFQTYPECEITDQTIEWSRRGVVNLAEQIVTTVRRLAFAASRLRADSETDQSLDQALEARREGRLDEAVEILEREGRENPEDEELVVWARETRDVGQNMMFPTAPTVYPPVVLPPMPEVEPAPASPVPEVEREIPEVVRESAAPASEREASEAPAIEPTVATVGPSDDLDAAVVCEDLFGSDVMSFDARRRFDERYKDRHVRWSGELRRVSSFKIDMIFSGESGTRMVADIHEVGGSVLGRTAQAIVRLPQDAEKGLRSRIGERISFEGRLLSCDGLMRNVFVADGKLL